jgi:hypothetical protein
MKLNDDASRINTLEVPAISLSCHSASYILLTFFSRYVTIILNYRCKPLIRCWGNKINFESYSCINSREDFRAWLLRIWKYLLTSKGHLHTRWYTDSSSNWQLSQRVFCLSPNLCRWLQEKCPVTVTTNIRNRFLFMLNVCDSMLNLQINLRLYNSKNIFLSAKFNRYIWT